MAEQLGHITRNEIVYEVILDERGMVWYIDAFNNPLRARTNVGQREGTICPNMDVAKEWVQMMLESMGR